MGPVQLIFEINLKLIEKFLNLLFSEPIAMNSSTVVCPFIDVIAYDTFEYRAQDEGARGNY